MLTITNTLSYVINVSYLLSGDGQQFIQDTYNEAKELQMSFSETSEFVKHHLCIRSTHLN